MTEFDYPSLDAYSLSALVRSGEIAPRDVVDAALNAIERLNPDLNAVVLVDAQRAFDAASRVERTSPLAGVPVLLKDNNVYAEGWPTTFGSKFFDNAMPLADSNFVSRLRKAGAIILGKTNLPEFAADWTTEPTFRGITRNPWDLSRSPGGSSGGSAAAVASGMVPVAHANDNAGSIRVPAAVCGLFGLKPSRGLTNAGPYFPELANGHNSEFVLTRSVRDAALLLDILTKRGANEEALYSELKTSYLSSLDSELLGRTIGLVIGLPGVTVEGEIVEETLRVAQTLAGPNGRIVEIVLPSLGDVYSDSEAMWASDALALVRGRERAIGRSARKPELEALTRHVIARVSRLSSTDLEVSRSRLREFSRKVISALDGVDLLVTPTVAHTAPLLGHFDSRTESFDYEEFGRRSYAFAPFTEMFNITGQPAASVCSGVTACGLPIGVQIVAPLGRDDQVLVASRKVHRLPQEYARSLR